VINSGHETSLYGNPPVTLCIVTLTPISLTLYSEEPHYVYYSVNARYVFTFTYKVMGKIIFLSI